MFPKDYDFHIVNDGIDRRSSMLRSGRHRKGSLTAVQKTDMFGRARRGTSTLSNTPGGVIANVAEIKNPQESHSMDDGGSDQQSGNLTSARHPPGTDAHMDNLAGAMSALNFVPPSVRFGRGRGKGQGFSRT